MPLWRFQSDSHLIRDIGNVGKTCLLKLARKYQSKSRNHPHPPPQVPSPTASPIEVHEFLVKLFLALDPTSNEAAAEEKATKVSCDGPRLYEVSREWWVKLYGLQGEFINNDIQRKVCFLLCFGILFHLKSMIYVLIATKRRLAPIETLSTW